MNESFCHLTAQKLDENLAHRMEHFWMSQKELNYQFYFKFCCSLISDQFSFFYRHLTLWFSHHILNIINLWSLVNSKMFYSFAASSIPFCFMCGFSLRPGKKLINIRRKKEYKINLRSITIITSVVNNHLFLTWLNYMPAIPWNWLKQKLTII